LYPTVSDPSHPKYGNHLSAQEVNELSQPEPKALQSVHDWLATHGFTKEKLEHNAAKDWIKFSVPVKDAENLLDTKYSVFKHEDGTEVIRTPQWSLPKDLHQHVVAIQPTNSFLKASPRRVMHKPLSIDSVASQVNSRVATMTDADIANATLADVCDPESITPTCLRKLYKTENYAPKAVNDPKNSVAVANYLGETSMDSDLKTFLNEYRKDAASSSIAITIVNNGSDTQKLGPADQSKQLNAEGNLDGQTISAIVYPMKVRAFNTGGSPPFKPDDFTATNTNEPYLEWLDYMLNTEKTLPHTVSTSYGDDEQTVPPDYALKVCQDMAKLGARGVTLLFASGDNGVGGDGACYSNDAAHKEGFLPAFPDGCPYVTSVGGTTGFNPEVAAWDPKNHFASGGGFSNYFGQPAYQKDAVSSYVKGLGNQFQNLYNASGRAYPDVAAQGQAYRIAYNGEWIHLDGTSASTPAMSGVIALLNDYRLANNKSPLGFLNPWLYKEGYKGFNDITSGSAKGCQSTGFPATAGWDAVTGFGSPVS
jgi:tripeptidyl-peptidase I